MLFGAVTNSRRPTDDLAARVTGNALRREQFTVHGSGVFFCRLFARLIALVCHGIEMNYETITGDSRQKSLSMLNIDNRLL